MIFHGYKFVIILSVKKLGRKDNLIQGTSKVLNQHVCYSLISQDLSNSKDFYVYPKSIILQLRFKYEFMHQSLKDYLILKYHLLQELILSLNCHFQVLKM